VLFVGSPGIFGVEKRNASEDPQKSAGLKGKLATLVAFGDP
jgi:hypothetical protein